MKTKKLPKDVRELIDGSSVKYYTEKFNWVRQQIIDGNYVRDRHDRVLLGKTSRKLGFSSSSLVHRMIKNVCKELKLHNYGWSANAPCAGNRAGMRVGPRVAKMAVRDFAMPGVYEIVCEPTGRRYVGSSSRPDLRRAVHSYWLRNPGRTGTSNIFAKNEDILRDIEKYGYEAFYFDIVELIPGATRHELMMAELKYMQSLNGNYYNLKGPNYYKMLYTGKTPEELAFDSAFAKLRTRVYKYRKIVNRTPEEQRMLDLLEAEYLALRKRKGAH